MDNKYVSTELIDEMAKVKDDFKILPKDIIEGMLEDMTAEEKELLLRQYIYGTNIDQKIKQYYTRCDMNQTSDYFHGSHL